MLTKLLSLLAAGKGGVVASAVVASGITVGVATTTPEAQDTLQEVSAAVSGVLSPGMSQLAKAGKIHDACERGQPVLVSQRNAADKLLREAYSASHRELTELRGGKDVDHQVVNEIVRTADRATRDVLVAALNEVAAETLGREGRLRTSSSPTPTPSASPTASASRTASPSPTAEPTCPPESSAPPSPMASPTPTGSPAATRRPEVRGRAAVAARTTLNATLQAIVHRAIEDMKEIVGKAKAEVAALPAVERGKPSEKPGGKPSEQPGAAHADHGKPTDKPGGRPSSPPGRP